MSQRFVLINVKVSKVLFFFLILIFVMLEIDPRALSC